MPDREEDAAKPQLKKRGCWTVALLMLSIPISILVLAFCFIAFQDRTAHQRAAEVLDELAEVGVPVGNASVDAAYREATDPRYADRWLAVLEQMRSAPYENSRFNLPLVDYDNDQLFVRPGGEWELREPVRDFLTTHKELLSEIEFLSLKQLPRDAKPVRFPMEFAGVNTLLEPWQDMLRVRSLVLLSGYEAVDRKESADVARAIRVLLGCSEVAFADLCQVTTNFRTRSRNSAANLLRDAIQYNVLSPADLTALLPLIRSRCQLASNWGSTLSMECGIFVLVYEEEYLEAGFKVLPFRGRDKLMYLETTAKLIEAPTTDIDSFYAFTQRLESQAFKNMSQSLPQLDNFNYAVSNELLSGRVDFALREINSVKRFRLLVAAMLLRVHEAEYGQMPGSLEELNGYDAKDLDPGGGKPLGYLQQNGKVLLWCSEDVAPTPTTPPEFGSEAWNEEFMIELEVSQ